MIKTLGRNLRIGLGVIGIFILLGILMAFYQAGLRTKQVSGTAAAPTQSVLPTMGTAKTSPTISPTPPVTKADFVGPRQNLPEGAPSAYGLWSFAEAVPGVISRSGQPLISGFTWMQQHGWKGDVDLRITGDHGDVADDAKLPGFSELGLNYLHLEIIDGHAPTNDQAMQFLTFVTNPANQPAEVHCRGGYGRTGTMIALYRYAVQGWPMDMAIAESRLFSGGVSDVQKAWLLQWAKDHAPASFKS